MAAQQPDSVITAITLSETVVPLGFMVLSAIAVVLLYKITPNNYAALVEALEAKKEGRDYSIDGFREIL